MDDSRHNYEPTEQTLGQNLPIEGREFLESPEPMESPEVTPVEPPRPERSIKSQIIPTEWKADIDGILNRELVAANRGFAATKDCVTELIQREAHNTPESFIKNLRSRWAWHNDFYENCLEPALPAITGRSLFDITPEQIDRLIGAYRTASLVDQATIVCSAAIKPHLQYWIEQEHLYGLSEEERTMLLTPPTESFWVQYHIDHLRYIAALNSNDHCLASQLQHKLLVNYHANDEEIMQGRMTRFNLHTPPETIRQQIERMQVPTDYKIRHLYLTLERPRLAAIRDTVIFDNNDEYLFLKSLIGISGFILRKHILNLVDQSKILPNDGSIYACDDTDVLAALEQLKLYRMNTLSRDVETTRQHNGETCSATCLAMALHYFGLSDLTIEAVDELYMLTKSDLIPGAHHSGLATEALRRGCAAELAHSEGGLFKNDGVFDNALFTALLAEYGHHLQEAENLGCSVRNGEPINDSYIHTRLEEGNLLIAAGKWGSAFHSILINGYSNDSYTIVDPISGKTSSVDKKWLENFMNTPLGSWILSLKKNSPEAVYLSERNDEFEVAASKHLSSNS